jgi:hypothetical protein
VNRGIAADGFTYPLRGPATESLATQPTYFRHTRACERFPSDDQIAAIGAQAVVAMRVTDAKARSSA